MRFYTVAGAIYSDAVADYIGETANYIRAERDYSDADAARRPAKRNYTDANPDYIRARVFAGSVLTIESSRGQSSLLTHH